MMDKRVWALMFAGRLDPRGRLFVGMGGVITLIFFLISSKLGVVGLLLTSFLVFFFRDPDRVSSSQPGAILSPADGLVLDIVSCTPPQDLGLPEVPWKRISIFLNLWDVHVNRIPVNGTVIHKSYRKGIFVPAGNQEASSENERCGIVIQTPEGHQVACLQIAGFLARRIVCDVNIADQILAGQRYGIICFGSRVDLYLPDHIPLLIREGQRMIAGETILGFLDASA